MGERLDGLGAALRTGALAGLCAIGMLAWGGCAGAQRRETGTLVVVEPALFIGMVEVKGDAERGFGVLLSTETEEVLVADGAVARRLARHEGELVAVSGRLLERASGPATIVVREFRVLGSDAREDASGGARSRAQPAGTARTT